MSRALGEAGLSPQDVGHVNAHGASMPWDDAMEAQAIREVLGDVPVTAPKSYFGNLFAAGGAVEMAASVLAFSHALVPRTLNYTRPDPECPVRVIAGEPLAGTRPAAMLVNWTRIGQAVAIVLAGAD